MKKILRNKKADISITVLVLGIIAVCFLTILSFVRFDSSHEGKMLGVGLIETINSVASEKNFESGSDFKTDYQNLFVKNNVKVSIEGNVFTGTYTEKGKELVKVIYKK